MISVMDKGSPWDSAMQPNTYTSVTVLKRLQMQDAPWLKGNEALK
jgi:hypothetical protein